MILNNLASVMFKIHYSEECSELYTEETRRYDISAPESAVYLCLRDKKTHLRTMIYTF